MSDHQSLWAESGNPGYWKSYEWIVVTGAIACFSSSWSIGAVDVANSFATSVGSKTLTLAQACAVAAVFEFAGTMAMGRSVVSTIVGDITKTERFAKEPDILMYGNLCALAAATIWVTMGIYLELAVSSTHSIVGAIIGFSWVWAGPSAVSWDVKTPNFPYRSGVLPIAIAWLISPFISGIFAMILFLFNRTFILRRENSTEIAIWTIPLLVLVTVFINVGFVLGKGAGISLQWKASQVAWVSTVAAAGCAVISAAAIPPLIQKHLDSFPNMRHESVDMGRVEMPTLEKPSRKKKTARKQEGWPGTEKLKVTWSDGIDGDQMPTHEPPDSCTQEEPESGTCTLGGADPAELEVETRGGAGPAFLSHGNGAEAATKRSDQSRFDGGYGAGPREAASGGNSFQEGESGPVTTGDGDGGKVSASDGSISRRDLRPQTVITIQGMWDPIHAPPLVVDSSQQDPTTPRMLAQRVYQQGREGLGRGLEQLTRAVTHGWTRDIHKSLEEDERLTEMHQAAEIFEPRTEIVYKVLQVFSACCVAFAHGSNDAANAVGPFSAIWYIYQEWAVPPPGAQCPFWILALGGVGIVLGLATYGYRIMRMVGVRMTKLTPSRGFCIELASALTVTTATLLGLPISTTQSVIGAEIGVGMCDSIIHGINWRLVAKFFSSWVATFFITAILSAAFFSQGAYSPSITMAEQLNLYEDAFLNLTSRNVAHLNQSINMSNGTIGWYNSTLVSEVAALQKELDYLAEFPGYSPPVDIFKLFYASDALVQLNSLLAVAYNVSSPNFTQNQATIPVKPSPQ